MRTVECARMNVSGSRLRLAALLLPLLAAVSGTRHLRRSMPTQQALPVSKGGWRPVVGSGGLVYGGSSYGTAPLHAPYKIPVLGGYPSSARPLVTRDSAKLTSIAQSYRPTTLRTVSAAPPAPPANQPISSYHNPFAFNNNLSYDYIQSFPVENIVIRNPQNPYAARPAYTKYPSKVKQSLQSNLFHQLTNVQPIQFGQYQTGKPLEVYGKPIEGYARPTDNKQAQSGTEIFKPEVFKLPDSDTAPQSVSQTVKTAQQHQQLAQQQQQHLHHQHHQQQQHHHQQQHHQQQQQPQQYQQQQQPQQQQHQQQYQQQQHQQHQQQQHQQQQHQQQQPHHPQQQHHQQQHQKHHQQQLHHQPQQFLIATPKTPYFTYQDSGFPPSILGTFGSFGLQSVKGRDPVFPHTKTTYLPPQPSKQTIFNSFSFAPTFKTTPTVFGPTTPKFQTTVNQLKLPSTFNDYNNIKNIPTQPTKLAAPVKIDPNENKGSFKASPQDPFTNKRYPSDHNKLSVTTYNPIQSTTLGNNYFEYNFQAQQNPQASNFYEQPAPNFNYQKKKQKIHDSVTANNNQATQQYASPPKTRPYYEVTENTESEDLFTHSSPQVWTQESFDSNPKTTEESMTKQLSPDIGSIKQTTTFVPELPEEYAIVTEAEKGYENSLSYDSQVESQSRRPLGDDFEPIGKHKLKDYYYKVSTPTYDDYSSPKRTKKPSESSKLTAQSEASTSSVNKENSNEAPADALPTLPPNRHFKRPTTTEPLDKDRIRKRNKNRRRRPPLANLNREEANTSTRKYVQHTTEQSQTTESDEIHTIKPRVRPTKSKPQPNLTTPSVTTDLTTSAVPTISPTAPTIIKKKLVRRPLTTVADRIETTTLSLKDYDTNKESPIMKIATRPQYSKYSSNYESADYTNKKDEDENQTPINDIAVSGSDTLKTTLETAKTFAFHKDVKPIEAKLETTTESNKGSNELTERITTTITETTPGNTHKVQRPRLKNKFNRPRFSVKDYRNRLSSTTSTTEKSTESTPKLRFPQRKVPNNDGENETTTERKKFMPKDPRHKTNGSELNEEAEKEIHSIRHRQRQTTPENSDGTTPKMSSRIRNGLRRPKPTEEAAETTTVHIKRPLRKKIKDSEIGESVHDISVTETTVHYEHKNDITSERTRSESAIMKIADKKHHQDPIEHLFEHSKRVSDLTLAASKDYNTPGMFKTVSSNSRRIPNYFTIATDDPILPIEAFFPQLNQKKES